MPRSVKSRYRFVWILAIPAVVTPIFLAVQGARGPARRTSRAGMPGHPLPNSFERLPPECHSVVNRAFESYLGSKPHSISRMLHRWAVLEASASWSENTTLQSEVREILSKDGFQRRFPGSPHLFFASPSGWRVRGKSRRPGQELWQGEDHVDQLLGVCAEIGVPFQQSVETTNGTSSIGQLLESSRIECVRDQELAWSVVAYCSYLPSQPTWRNRFGEEMSYDLLALELLARTPGAGPCNGIHTLISLTHILFADAQSKIIAPKTRRQIEARLRDTSLLLVQSQLACGAWPTSWAESSSSDFLASQDTDGSPNDLVRVTGHHLEWILKAPQNLRPGEDTTDDAVKFLVKSIEGQDSEDILGNYCGFSHALRILLILKSDSERKSLQSGASHLEATAQQVGTSGPA